MPISWRSSRTRERVRELDVGRAFEFVEPLFAVLEIVQDDKSPLRTDLLEESMTLHAPLFCRLVRGHLQLSSGATWYPSGNVHMVSVPY